MAESSIPVDLFNPGQVFACLGFLEAADVLCGDAQGGFDWRDEAEARFCLRAEGDENPFEVVLAFLAEAKVKAEAPEDWRPKKVPTTDKAKEKLEEELRRLEKVKVFPSASPETSSPLPVQIINSKRRVTLGHWADGSSRNAFKLYAGNRSAYQITDAMLRDIAQLWVKRRNEIIERPFITAPMGGSFNFDSRGGWVAIDSGYSLNDQKPKHKITASPVVELLTAWGLENARPDEYQTRKVRYSVWGISLPLMLARAALSGGVAAIPTRRFHFELQLSGKNKIIAFAEQEV